MNERYQKVLVLYLLANAVVKVLNGEFKIFKWIKDSLVGYTIFSIGLREMTKRKNR